MQEGETWDTTTFRNDVGLSVMKVSFFFHVIFPVSESFHMLEDGHYMFEVEGLCDSEPDAHLFPNAKPPSRVTFSTGPIRVCADIFFLFNFQY